MFRIVILISLAVAGFATSEEVATCQNVESICNQTEPFDYSVFESRFNPKFESILKEVENTTKQLVSMDKKLDTKLDQVTKVSTAAKNKSLDIYAKLLTVYYSIDNVIKNKTSTINTPDFKRSVNNVNDILPDILHQIKDIRSLIVTLENNDIEFETQYMKMVEAKFTDINVGIVFIILLISVLLFIAVVLLILIITYYCFIHRSKTQRNPPTRPEESQPTTLEKIRFFFTDQIPIFFRVRLPAFFRSSFTRMISLCRKTPETYSEDPVQESSSSVTLPKKSKQESKPLVKPKLFLGTSVVNPSAHVIEMKEIPSTSVPFLA